MPSKMVFQPVSYLDCICPSIIYKRFFFTVPLVKIYPNHEFSINLRVTMKGFRFFNSFSIRAFMKIWGIIKVISLVFVAKQGNEK